MRDAWRASVERRVRGNVMLKQRTLFITGASRGIGLAIACRAARDGANIALAAKTTEPHPRLPGTIYTAAEEVRAAGGNALPLIVDVRSEASVREAMAATAKQFGGIDILINNASAISLTDTPNTVNSFPSSQVKNLNTPMSLCRKEQPLTLEVDREMVETTFYSRYADGLHESKWVLTGLAVTRNR